MSDRQPARNEADLELARRITAGSVSAWQAFILRYSGLIYSVIRRFVFDPEDVRTVYVDVLERLYRGKLTSYEGRSALSTWLVLVTRTTALDFLRKRFGRREMPTGLKRLSKLDREIYRRFYLDGMSFEGVIHWAAQEQRPLGPDELVAILNRIERQLDQRVLRRIAYNLHASSVGAVSGRLLEFLDQHRADMERAGRSQTPEQALLDKEARRLAEQVRRLLDELPEEERRILTLRFDEGRTAVDIAAEMGLESPRRAYTLIERGLRQLRALLGISKEQP